MHQLFLLIDQDLARERRRAEAEATLEAERAAQDQQVADARADLAGKLATRIGAAPAIQELAPSPAELARLGEVMVSTLEAIYRDRPTSAGTVAPTAP